jgi:hypothetical protein
MRRLADPGCCERSPGTWFQRRTVGPGSVPVFTTATARRASGKMQESHRSRREEFPKLQLGGPSAVSCLRLQPGARTLLVVCSGARHAKRNRNRSVKLEQTTPALWLDWPAGAAAAWSVELASGSISGVP